MSAGYRSCSRCGLSRIPYRSQALVCDDCRGVGRHTEGSCSLCTGWHDAEEAAFLNRRGSQGALSSEGEGLAAWRRLHEAARRTFVDAKDDPDLYDALRESDRALHRLTTLKENGEE